MFFDTRLRARAHVLEGWSYDVLQFRRGIALLRANTDGFVGMAENELQIVAGRVDLAAARLRARVKDLAALREQGTENEVSKEDVERLVCALEGEGS